MAGRTFVCDLQPGHCDRHPNVDTTNVGPARRHYCPAHHDQAPQHLPWTPCWRSECRTTCAYPASCTGR